MQWSCCSLRDSHLQEGRHCCRSCSRRIVSPLQVKGALLLLRNVPPGTGPKAGSWALERSLRSVTWDAAYDWSAGQKIYLQEVHQATERERNHCWKLRLMGLGNATQESTGWAPCWGRDMTADSAKAAWAPLSVSSSSVCCWLFSKSIKATSEIPLVS